MIDRRSFMGLGALAVAAAACRPAVAANTCCAAKKGKVNFKFGMAGFSCHRLTLDETLQLMKKLDLHYLCIKDFHLPIKSTQAEIDAATLALKEAAATFNAARVVINLTDLKAAITAAQKVLSDAQGERGDGPGKFPESAFLDLQQVITESQTMVNENKVNQTAVDDQTTKLLGATSTFQSSRIPNDYSVLQALVDEATNLIADAEAGKIPFLQEDLDELKASVEKNAAALESTDQDVIDRAVKLLRRDIALFKGLSDGVELLNSDVASIQLYDLNGRPVTSSRRHLTRDTYIMKVTAGDKNVTRKITVR